MCDTADDGVGISNSLPSQEQLRRAGLRSEDISTLMPFARALANARENRDSHVGFVGYNKTAPGDKILIAVDREYDPEVRKLAEKYGDPADLLREDWIPLIPGINCAGSYTEYASDPGNWIYTQE